MARFFQQYGLGRGDYTAEREGLLAGITLDEILEGMKNKEREKQ
jgi:hypothetical protein